METKKVYAAINAVTTAMATDGISKSRKNQQQGYQFRGIDDVYNALSRELANAKLCVLPRVLERGVVERETKNGGVLFYVTVKVDFAFVSAEDGSEHVVTTYGEAMDSGDKATNKAMSAAYKYAAMQAFCIPTEGDNDADATTHAVKPAAKPEPKPEPRNIHPHAEASDLKPDELIEVGRILERIHEMFGKGFEVGAYDFLESQSIGTEAKSYLATQLDETERKAFRKIYRERNPSIPTKKAA